MSFKILVVGPSWVGDMMMAHVFFQLLRQQNPAADIHVLAPAWSHALLARMPEINRAIELPFGHGELKLGARYRFGKQLRAEKYDQAFVLPNSLKSALIPYFARIPKRTGFLGEYRFIFLNNIYFLDKKALPKMVQRFAALAYPPKAMLAANLPTPQLFPDQQNILIALEKYHLKKDKPILALCPGAEFGPSKCWPAEYYAAVANQKISEGWQVWLFGSAKDKTVADDINQQTQNQCENLVGKTALSDAVDLLSLSKMVVTNDSGLMHIAAALGCSLIALYGSTSPDFTPPLTEKAVILKLDLDCQPCFQRVCPLKHHHCMKLLTPDRVIALF